MTLNRLYLLNSMAMSMAFVMMVNCLNECKFLAISIVVLPESRMMVSFSCISVAYCYTTEETEKLELMRLTDKLGGNIELAIRQLAESKRNSK